MDPTLFAHASTITFLFAWSSPYNDLLQQPARKNEPDRKFFLRTHPISTRPTGRCPDLYAMLPKSSSPMHSNQLRSIFVSTPEKKSLSVFFRSPPGPTHSGNLFALPAPPPAPQSIHRMERIRFSAALHSSSLRSVYIITTQFFRSSFFCFSRNLKNGPLITPAPPTMSDYVSCVRVRLAFWFGFRQSGSIDCSLFSPVLYYLLITGDSVYLVVVVVVYSSFDTLTHQPPPPATPSPRTPPPTIR